MEENLTEEKRKEIGIEFAKTQFANSLIPMLEEAWGKGINEFRLVTRIETNNYPTNFYIHPLSKDGETIDISWAPISALVEKNIEEE